MADNNDKNNGTQRDWEKDFRDQEGRAKKAEIRLQQMERELHDAQEQATRVANNFHAALTNPTSYRYWQAQVRGTNAPAPPSAPPPTGDGFDDDALAEMTPEIRKIVRQNQQFAQQITQMQQAYQQTQAQLLQATQALNSLNTDVNRTWYDQWFDRTFADRQFISPSVKKAIKAQVGANAAQMQGQYKSKDELLAAAAEEFLTGETALPMRDDLVKSEQATDKAQVEKATTPDAVIPSDGVDGGQVGGFDFDSPDWSSKPEAERIAALESADAAWVQQAAEASPEGMFS